MRLIPLSLLFALCALPADAHADDITAGSNFTYTIAQYDTTSNGYTTLSSWSLSPGTTIPFVLGATAGVISEAHTALAGGYDLFTFTFTADGDIFPEYTPGDDYLGLVGIEGLQFDTPYQPTSAVLTFSSPSGIITFSDGSLADADFIDDISNPFDGNFVSNGKLAGYDTIGGLNTTNITLQLSNAPVSSSSAPPPLDVPVPEPSSLALLATGILTAAGAARRKLL